MMRDIMSYTQDLMTRAGYPAFKSDRHIKGNTGRMRVWGNQIKKGIKEKEKFSPKTQGGPPHGRNKTVKPGSKAR